MAKSLHELKQASKTSKAGNKSTITDGDYVLRDKSKENGKNTFRLGEPVVEVAVIEAPKKKVAPKKDD